MDGGRLMSKFLFFKAFLVPAIFFIILAGIASLQALSTFSLINDSFSMLGGQNFENQWIMNVAWMGFGGLVVVIITSYHYKEELPVFVTYPIMAFGFAVFFLGIFSADSLLTSGLVDVDEVQDHYFFYGIAVIAISLSMAFHALMTRHKTYKLINLGFLSVVIGLTMMYIVLPYGNGLIEKCSWLVVLIWLISMFGRMKEHGNIH